MGLDPYQFTQHIIQPVLSFLDPEVPASAVAAQLLLGTALQESGLEWLVQAGGPANGIMQIEPATERSIWADFLAFRPALRAKLQALLGGIEVPNPLISNLGYAVAVARLIYFRAPNPLPQPGDLEGLGIIYKAVYNTADGAGSVAQFVANLRAAA